MKFSEFKWQERVIEIVVQIWATLFVFHNPIDFIGNKQYNH